MPRATRAPDVADELAEQARGLFGHLPRHEIAHDERLLFRTDDAGHFVVWLPRTGSLHGLWNGRAIRMRAWGRSAPGPRSLDSGQCNGW